MKINARSLLATMPADVLAVRFGGRSYSRADLEAMAKEQARDAMGARECRGAWVRELARLDRDVVLNEVDEALTDVMDLVAQQDEERVIAAAHKALLAARHPEPLRDADRALWVRRMARHDVLQTIADRIATTPTGQVTALLDALDASIETLATAFDEAVVPREMRGLREVIDETVRRNADFRLVDAIDCPACATAAKKGVRIVRDCLASCSECGAQIQSIDYVHTCRGGKLCTECWKKRGVSERTIVLALRALPRHEREQWYAGVEGAAIVAQAWASMPTASGGVRIHPVLLMQPRFDQVTMAVAFASDVTHDERHAIARRIWRDWTEYPAIRDLATLCLRRTGDA